MLTKFGVVGLLLLAPVAAEAASISTMNSKLSRYVHKTGKCGAASEQMVTMYGNGDGHVGKPVACGGVLDTKRPTVAHRKLACGTKLSLHNPRNGRSVTVTVTDRGPYTIATLDLGPAAYRALGLNTSAYICVSNGG